MGETIRVEMNDWLFNAGLVGIYNILKHSGDEVIIKGQYLQINSDLLKDFEIKYFKYFIDTYEPTMIFSKIKKTTQLLLNQYMDKGNLNDYKKDIDFLNSKLDNSAYKNLRKKITKKRIKNIKKADLEEILKYLDKNRQEILQIECTGYYEQRTKKSKSPNAIIDKYINTNMLDIKFICNEIFKYTQKNRFKNDIQCFTCARPIKKIDKGLSFLTNVFFDTSRKTSHVWNFKSDIETCPICKLIYFCVPAGFTTVFGKGIFINANYNMGIITNVNTKLRMELLREYDADSLLTYKALINSFKEQINDNNKYELADIQIIRYEKDKDSYRFNILSKNMLQVIKDSKHDLDSIVKASYTKSEPNKKIKTHFYIYELVVSRILNNQNLFTLIHKLNVHKLSSPKDCRFGTRQIIKLLNINYRILEVMGYMKNSKQDIIKKANISGYYLREQYKGRGAKDKLNGISYRLLNALKTSNQDMFMDTLLNCYLYAQKTVPQIFVEALKDDETFKTIGYAFVTGLIEGKENTDENGGKNNDK